MKAGRSICRRREGGFREGGGKGRKRNMGLKRKRRCVFRSTLQHLLYVSQGVMSEYSWPATSNLFPVTMLKLCVCVCVCVRHPAVSSTQCDHQRDWGQLRRGHVGNLRGGSRHWIRHHPTGTSMCVLRKWESLEWSSEPRLSDCDEWGQTDKGMRVI